MHRSLLVTIAIILSWSIAEAEEFSTIRADGTELTYYFDAPIVADYPIVIFAQGSTCSSAFQKHEQTKGVFLSQNFAVLTLEKRGLKKDTIVCPQEYLIKNSISDRVLDYLYVVSQFRANHKGWNEKIIWAAGSEGATVASLATPLVPESHLLILLGLGGGETMADDMLTLTEKQMREEGARQANIEAALGDMKSMFRTIHNEPTPWKEWLSDGQQARNTYKWWAEILPVKPLTYLERIKIPIFLGHGTLDKAVPVESADTVDTRFSELKKSNLSYFRYEGLNHSWQDTSGQSHFNRVMGDIFDWIKSNSQFQEGL